MSVEVKTVYFGLNEEAALDFVERNWGNVSSIENKTGSGDADGWYVGYSKEEVPVITTQLIPRGSSTAKTAPKAKTRG